MTANPGVLIAQEALAAVQAAGLAALPRETGGILAGFRTQDGVVVTAAVVVPDASSSGRAYLRREGRARSALEGLRADAPPVVGYVGEWHTHPAEQPPSSTDLATLTQIAAASDDLVALLVLPFDGTVPKPPHVLVCRRRAPRGLARRPELVSRPAELTTSSSDTRDLEARAQAALDLTKERTP